jgi:hypothetical protein
VPLDTTANLELAVNVLDVTATSHASAEKFRAASTASAVKVICPTASKKLSAAKVAFFVAFRTAFAVNWCEGDTITAFAVAVLFIVPFREASPWNVNARSPE